MNAGMAFGDFMMEPYFQNELVTLYKGDCLEIMPQLEEKFDACITDPPYGTTACKWDAVIPFDRMWAEIRRLVKHAGVTCLFGSEPFSSLLRCSNLDMFKYDWIWSKKTYANFLNIKFQPGKVHEIVSVFSDAASTYSSNGDVMAYYPQCEPGEAYVQRSGKQKTEKNNSTVRCKIDQIVTVNEGIRYPVSILEFLKDKETLHPTQKPVKLIEYLVRTYAPEGGSVLDFCAGSGTTGVACMNANRKCVLIESDEHYCEVIRDRLSSHVVQLELF